MSLAALYVKLGKFDEAIAQYDAVLADSPGYLAARRSKLETTGDRDAAAGRKPDALRNTGSLSRSRRTMTTGLGSGRRRGGFKNRVLPEAESAEAKRRAELRRETRCQHRWVRI